MTAICEKAEEGGYLAYIEEIPGVNSQGENIEEAKSNLREALELVWNTRRELMEKELKEKPVIKRTKIFSA